MKASNFTKYIRPLILTLGMAWGCTGLPTQEMSDARQAVQAAREVGAANYAPDSLGKAETLLDKAKTALDQGDYATARGNALEAKDEAMNARNKTLETNKPTAH